VCAVHIARTLLQVRVAEVDVLKWHGSRERGRDGGRERERENDKCQGAEQARKMRSRYEFVRLNERERERERGVVYTNNAVHRRGVD
jgi:hypothetical protein